MSVIPRAMRDLHDAEGWDSYPGFDEDDEDTDCLGPDDPDDWESEADEPGSKDL